jgi:uncharacterized tellurite resistance protein B-like protein
MDPDSQHHQLLKIVCGSAWVDGHLEPAEVKYLELLQKRYHLIQDPELRDLLHHPVSLQQTEQWMVDYLRDATDQERMQLLGSIGNLLIADQEVSEEEHRLLDDYYTLMSSIPPHPESTPVVIKTLGGFVKRVVKSVQSALR